VEGPGRAAVTRLGPLHAAFSRASHSSLQATKARAHTPRGGGSSAICRDGDGAVTQFFSTLLSPFAVQCHSRLYAMWPRSLRCQGTPGGSHPSPFPLCLTASCGRNSVSRASQEEECQCDISPSSPPFRSTAVHPLGAFPLDGRSPSAWFLQTFLLHCAMVSHVRRAHPARVVAAHRSSISIDSHQIEYI
jgi:hypothetical protein